jgi:hypothetical protein
LRYPNNAVSETSNATIWNPVITPFTLPKPGPLR